MSKQDIVVKMVKESKYTRQEIKDAAECTSGSLASHLSMMANAAKYTGEALCPIEEEIDGKKVMTVKTYNEVQDAKEARKGSTASRSTKSPAERLKAAELRLVKCTKAAAKFDERMEVIEDDDIPEELQLRNDKAQIDVRLAEIDVETMTQLVANTPTEGEEEVDIPEEDELM